MNEYEKQVQEMSGKRKKKKDKLKNAEPKKMPEYEAKDFGVPTQAFGPFKIDLQDTNIADLKEDFIRDNPDMFERGIEVTVKGNPVSDIRKLIKSRSLLELCVVERPKTPEVVEEEAEDPE